MMITTDRIFCSLTEAQAPRLEFDMQLATMAESRVRDIAYVRPDTAPELLALFNEAYLLVSRYCAELELELQRGYNRAERRRAVVILDEVPDLIKAKQLGNARSPLGSEDIREAFVQKDSEYQAIQDGIASLKATKELMYMKLKGFDMAYTSIKKILSDQQSRYGSNFNVSIPEAAEPGNVIKPTEIVAEQKLDAPPVAHKGGWGKPKYT